MLKQSFLHVYGAALRCFPFKTQFLENEMVKPFVVEDFPHQVEMGNGSKSDPK